MSADARADGPNPLRRGAAQHGCLPGSVFEKRNLTTTIEPFPVLALASSAPPGRRIASSIYH